MNCSPTSFVANSFQPARSRKHGGRECLARSRRPLFHAFPAAIAVAFGARIIEHPWAFRESKRSPAAIPLTGGDSYRGGRPFADAARMLLYTVANKPIRAGKHLPEVSRSAKSRHLVANLGLLSQVWELPC